jgi:hypothetical protein
VVEGLPIPLRLERASHKATEKHRLDGFIQPVGGTVDIAMELAEVLRRPDGAEEAGKEVLACMHQDALKLLAAYL